ncbi:hypothetical protein [Bacillus sp. S3]|uniref:hypothetical protein n=1 Tax=Bacillus sp. S3 TaxID=486398 RepID=UPI0016816972|nr:hypothetical protein [Bacillus sp. S3]
MINELTETIYELTVEMHRALLDKNDEKFEKFMYERNEIMLQINTLKASDAEFHYSSEATQWLEDSLQLDRKMVPLIKMNMDQTKNLISQMKVNKQVSKKYQPYYKQTNGAFIDAKN